MEQFADDAFCRSYIQLHKWKEKKSCLMCGAGNFRIGSTRFHRRCTGCGYEESVLKGTLFENLRFPLSKALYIVMRVRSCKRTVSCYKLRMETGLTVKTILRFKKMMQQRLEIVKNRTAHLDSSNFLDSLL